MFKLNRKTIIILAIVAAFVVILAVIGPVEVWNTVLLQPMLNFLILLSSVFFGSFGVAIIVLTIIVRLLTFPLTLRQMQASKAMSTIAPRMQELQKKYGKDQEKLRKEISALYKESGVNPLGCTWPMLVQFPIWIALYQSITRALATTPEELINLSQNLYSLPIINRSVPLEAHFLWLNLGVADTYFVLAILCGGSMYILQKMSTMPTPDPRQQSMTRTMVFMMPLMFGMFTLMVPSGLGLFWVISNIIGIVMQYFVTGWGGLTFRRPATAPAAAPAAATAAKQQETPVGAEQEAKLATGTMKEEKGLEYGQPGDKRKDRRRSRRDRPRKARRYPR